MMQDKDDTPSGLALVVLRNEFYKDHYYIALFSVIVLLILNVGLLVSIIYIWMNPVAPKYFATTPDGRIIMLHSLKDPMVTDDFVLQWSSDAVRQAFSLDFLHWRKQLTDASDNFTEDGWRWFSDSLKKSNNLSTLSKLKMVSNVKIVGAPEVIEKAVISGHFVWKVKMQLLLTYARASRAVNMTMGVIIIVLRMPKQYYSDGIAINNFIAQTETGHVIGETY